MFGWPDTSGKSHSCSQFSPHVDTTLSVFSLELQSWLCGAFQTQRCHWLCFLRPQLSVCGSNPALQNDLNFPINGVDHS